MDVVLVVRHYFLGIGGVAGGMELAARLPVRWANASSAVAIHRVSWYYLVGAWLIPKESLAVVNDRRR